MPGVLLITALPSACRRHEDPLYHITLHVSNCLPLPLSVIPHK
jgi:hypothetical protein